MKMKLSALSVLAAAVLCSSGALAADNVYTWKNGKGNSYSDTPNRLQLDRSNVMNIRTHSVKAAVKPKSEAADEGTLAEQQAKLNERMLAKNKLIEEQNKKIEEENRKNKEDNCRVARMNQQSAESARVANRDDLVKRYQGDVAKYCN